VVLGFELRVITLCTSSTYYTFAKSKFFVLNISFGYATEKEGEDEQEQEEEKEE
jgi:hypothetical protein